ncbi:MAG TPA: hypothetical protein VGJ05_04280 [Fimbriiglobus sp.]|jgi:hypothetical protein
MAREAPPQNTIYTGMLAVSLGAILVGCFVLALELSKDYDWAITPPAGPTITLPSKTASSSGSGTQGAAVVLPKDTATAQATPAPIPAVTTATLPPPAALPTIVAAAPTPKPEAATPTAQPATKPAGIIPSPLKLPGDRK